MALNLLSQTRLIALFVYWMLLNGKGLTAREEFAIADKTMMISQV
jgi:hypothetical protein